MDKQQMDDATLEWIAAGEELLEKAAEVAEDIEERTRRTLDSQGPLHTWEPE
jgi:hypothetical protein